MTQTNLFLQVENLCKLRLKKPMPLSTDLLASHVGINRKQTVFLLEALNLPCPTFSDLRVALRNMELKEDIGWLIGIINGIAEVEVYVDSAPLLCVLIPRSRGFKWLSHADDQALAISRFAFLLPCSEGALLETCHGTATGRVSTDVLQLLSKAASPDGLDPYGRGLAERACLFLLSGFGFLLPVNSVDTLPTWEFHDLLFHTRSRLGRTDKPIGGNYRFYGVLPPEGAVKARPVGIGIFRLPPAPVQLAIASEARFMSVLEQRRSIRVHGSVPITIEELSAFLFLSCRIKSRYSTYLGDFTSRPYPSGGGSYEFEVYIASSMCQGLPRGFYYYDAADHLLVLLSKPVPDFECLLLEASTASGGASQPQLVLYLASRFRRVSWKYSGISYATQLKNAGVILSTFYNVATSLRLAGCALGLGNPERVCALTGSDFYEEGAIAEFMLGSRIWTS